MEGQSGTKNRIQKYGGGVIFKVRATRNGFGGKVARKYGSRESAPTNNREQPQTTAQQNTARRGWGVSCGHETVVEN